MTSAIDNSRELSVTRYIAAPPDKVWQVMTERQTEWWCPLPWRAEIVEQDWRAGGRTAMIFKGPEGEEMPQEGFFLEVTPGRRFVSTDCAVRDADGEWRTADSFMIGIWEIAAEGDGTRYTGIARHWSEEKYKQHIEMGFEAGWGAAADQLVALCEGDS
ncbi:MAG: SRPBCC domain-containing protein [Sphingorhabdus sp.]